MAPSENEFDIPDLGFCFAVLSSFLARCTQSNSINLHSCTESNRAVFMISLRHGIAELSKTDYVLHP